MAKSLRKNTPGAAPHVWILATGLAFALLLWTWWVGAGMAWTRTMIGARVPHSPAAASAPDDRDHAFTELGLAGDAFGGLNALLTAIAGVFVAWAGTLQFLALQQAQAEAEEERAARRRQQFESLFFQLLALLAEATSRIDGPWRPHVSTVPAPGQRTVVDGSPDPHGARALDAYARRLFQSVRFELADAAASESQTLVALVRAFAHEVHDQRPSAFGPYFRLLHQVFQLVAESPLPADEQERHADIARGQIGDGALLLLALHGLTAEGQAFAPLVERFGLLENLHRRYARHLQPALRVGYRARAFMGRAAREAAGIEWVTTPLLPRAFRQALEDERMTWPPAAGAGPNVEAEHDWREEDARTGGHTASGRA